MLIELSFLHVAAARASISSVAASDDIPHYHESVIDSSERQLRPANKSRARASITPQSTTCVRTCDDCTGHKHLPIWRHWCRRKTSRFLQPVIQQGHIYSWCDVGWAVIKNAKLFCKMFKVILKFVLCTDKLRPNNSKDIGDTCTFVFRSCRFYVISLCDSY